MEQANRQPKQDGTARTKRTAGKWQAGPGGAGQAQKRQAACKPETKPTTAKRQAGSAGQTKNGGQPQAGNKAVAHRQKNAGTPGAKVREKAAGDKTLRPETKPREGTSKGIPVAA